MVSYNFSDISPYDDSLPVKLLEEAFAERYCESKKVTKKIWDTVLNKFFPGTPVAEPGRDNVRLVVDAGDEFLNNYKSGAVKLVQEKGRIFAQIKSNGKYGKKLPLKEEHYLDGPDALSVQNAIYLQALGNSLRDIAKQIETIDANVKEVLAGQQNDRLGLYYSGVALYLEASRITDQSFRNQLISQSIKTLSDAVFQLTLGLKSDILYLADKKYNSDKKRAYDLLQEKMLSVEPPLDLTVHGNEEEIAKRLNGVLLPNGSIRLNKTDTKISELYGFKEGLWWVQDFAASLPIFLLKNVKGKKVLDLCAAPGGKTAQLLAGGAKVTALDVDKERMDRLKNNIKRLNLEQNLQTEVADALEFLAHSNEVFDIIVLDAPCSATGTFRRHPEVLHIKTTDDVKNALVLQEKMLDAVSSHMAKDGILLYCTCSIAKDEGEKQIKRFLERHPEFELLPFEDKELKVVEEKIIDNGVLRTLPYYMKEKGGMDAFFAARLQKKA